MAPAETQDHGGSTTITDESLIKTSGTTPSQRETPQAPVYFLGDAHLGVESETDERSKVQDLVALLEALRARAGHLYLMGDVFDFWFEYPSREPREHREVLSALSLLSASGTRVRFLGGNHDYWAADKFETSTGATVHREPLVVTHFGRRLFIAHGDGLPRGDGAYRLLKAVIRNRLAIAAFRLIPPRAGAAIARWASGLSNVTDDRVARALPPMKEFIREKLRAGFDGVVVGHVHRQMLFESEDGTGVIVGDWMSGRSVVELGPGGFRALRWTGDGLVDALGAADPAAVA